MSVEVVMPQMGESITEGTVSKWLKSVGDKIEKDEPILEISTDKVDAEVPSPAAGTLLEIRHQEGDTVEVGTALAVIGAAEEVPSPKSQAEVSSPKSQRKSLVPSPKSQVRRLRLQTWKPRRRRQPRQIRNPKSEIRN